MLDKKPKNRHIANDLSTKKVAQKPNVSDFSGEFSDISTLCAYLDKTNPKTKVRIVFQDYELWRDFLPHYNKYKEKFFVFRDKKDFLISETIQNNPKKEKTTLKDSLIKFMKENKIEKKIQDILLEEIK